MSDHTRYLRQLLGEATAELDAMDARAENRLKLNHHLSAPQRSKATAWDMVIAALDEVAGEPLVAFGSGKSLAQTAVDFIHELKSRADTAFAMGQQDAKNTLLRNAGIPPEMVIAIGQNESAAPPGKPYAEVNVTAEHLSKAQHLGTIRLSTAAVGENGKVTFEAAPKQGLEPKHGDFKPLSESMSYDGKVVTVLKTEWDYLLAFKNQTYQYAEAERKTLASVGLQIEYGDFGDGPGYLRSTEPPRRDIAWKPVNRVMVHYKGIPVYACGLLGTHPENWEEIEINKP